jgi:hypothetical protein
MCIDEVGAVERDLAEAQVELEDAQKDIDKLQEELAELKVQHIVMRTVLSSVVVHLGEAGIYKVPRGYTYTPGDQLELTWDEKNRVDTIRLHQKEAAVAELPGLEEDSRT